MSTETTIGPGVGEGTGRGSERRPRTPRRGRPGSARDAAAGWLFSSPGLILLLTFMIAPFAMALYFSFTNQRLISPLPTRFVGLENYTQVLGSASFCSRSATT